MLHKLPKKKYTKKVLIHADMQKDILFFTQTGFEAKIFCPKKCINYDKSISQQNSVKGPKDHNSAKNAKKLHKVKKCVKGTKKR